MFTKSSLINDLTNAGINKSGTLLVHSSMKSIGKVEGGAETVLDAFIDYMKDGLLIFPTHSWADSSLANGIYDPKTEPSCVGLLTNLFMQREGVYRSLHPTHSVSAIGNRAMSYVEKDNNSTTPCPRNGCFGSLYDEKADILFLGVSLKTNTFIHSIEEWLQVPYRLRKNPTTFKIKMYTGETKTIKCYEHTNVKGNVSKNYDIIEHALLYNGIAKEVLIGDAKSYLVKAKPMADLVVSLLNKKQNLFEGNEPIPREWYM